MVSDPQVGDLALVSVGYGASEDQRVVGQREAVAAAGMSHGRTTPRCRTGRRTETYACSGVHILLPWS